ncbi:MAG TPA: tetratricopeptide repeat protein, partial [Burkholderiaceae bacterium]|nr:tetratricopeptide repeat protein [Burkholderiaceae bacterium]
MKLLRLIVIAGVVLVASCAAILPPPPVSENSAVVALVDNARTDVEAGRFPNAVAALERALRIEPKNPRIWNQLARLRLKEGDYEQAEGLAARSNSWAGADNDLRAQNWQLISEARAARGDDAGAKAALERAKQAER